MRRIPSLAIAAAALLGSADATALISTPPPAFVVPGINAVIGNESYVALRGYAPSRSVPERERIQIHLAYVDNLLRAADVSHLTAAQQGRRRWLLDELARYWQRGVFPRNERYAHRRPHFIDTAGRLCAVGHLVAHSAGRALAEAIDRRYSYAYVAQMRLPTLARWAEWAGFSPRELATIQPAYSDPSLVAPNQGAIKSLSLIVTPLLGLGAMITAFGNGFSAHNAGWQIAGAVFGGLTLLAAVTAAVLNHDSLERSSYDEFGMYYGPPPTRVGITVALPVGIATGITAIGLALYNARKRRPEARRSVWSLSPMLGPGPRGGETIGLTLRGSL